MVTIVKKLAVLAMAGAILVSCMREGSKRSDPIVSIGSHSLQIRAEGKGAPTVVIDAGIMDQLDKLRLLQERLARDTRVVTYNRAGYGKSEAGPLPRNSRREANELKTLLEEAGVPGPYVLVGHSLGALNMQMFAAMYPGDVVGIILLDPPPLSFLLGREYRDLRVMAERMTAEWQAMADSAAKATDAEGKAWSAYFQMIASEHHEMFGESARLVDGIATFGDIPLVVLASGKPNPAFGEVAEEYQRYWVEQSRALTGKSTKGKFVFAEKASHYLYLDVPDLVVESITSLVNAARAK